MELLPLSAGLFGGQSARFRDDLGADWLDRLEVIIAIEDQVAGFEMANVVADQIDTVGDLMRAIEGQN
jgi:acyl carrier protein